MSQVKLRSRNFRLSQNDIEILTIKRSLRRNKSCENESGISSKKIFCPNLNGDKNGSESSLAETLSLTGQNCCKWDKCDFEYNSINDDLEMHIISHHVKGQLCSANKRHFQCLWSDCKVYGRKSLSYAWLERHIIEHTEGRNKPFACVFNCSMRFGSQIMLERHVQSHLTETDNQHFNNDRNIDDSSIILSAPFNIHMENKTRKSGSNSKKLRLELTPYHVHRSDMLDGNILNQICRSNCSSQIFQKDTNLFDDSLEIDEKSQNADQIKLHIRLLLTHTFEVTGSRETLNGISENLIKFHINNNRFKYEWISNQIVGACIKRNLTPPATSSNIKR